MIEFHLKSAQYHFDTGAVALLVMHPLFFPGGAYLNSTEDALQARTTPAGNNWGNAEALAEAQALAAVDERFAGLDYRIILAPPPASAPAPVATVAVPAPDAAAAAPSESAPV
jgi:hypothetical protein